MENPEWERVTGDDLTHTGRLVPVYPLTQGLSQRVLRRVVKEAVDRYANLLRGPAARRRCASATSCRTSRRAVAQMHYPDTAEKHEEARRRVAFEELLCVQLAVLERRLAVAGRPRARRWARTACSMSTAQSLPFALTGAQERVLGEIIGRPQAQPADGAPAAGRRRSAARRRSRRRRWWSRTRTATRAR